jgi:hypothetical protein
VFGRYSIEEVLIFFLYIATPFIITAALFNNAVKLTNIFFSDKAAAAKIKLEYVVKSIIVGVSLVLYFWNLFDFLNVTCKWLLVTVYGVTYETLFTALVAHPQDFVVITFFLLGILLTMLFVTLLFRSTILYALIPKNYRDTFEIWYFFIVQLALIFFILYAAFVISVLFNPAQLTLCLKCKLFAEFMQVVCAVALEHLVTQWGIVIILACLLLLVLLVFKKKWF